MSQGCGERTGDVTRSAVRIDTRDGVADAHWLMPVDRGPWPAVLFYMDGLGLRPGLVAMTERLAEQGYAVLLPNLYYRAGPRAPFDPGTALTDAHQREQVFALYGSIDGAMVMRDTLAFIEWLGREPHVDAGRIGCVGYCMGGGFALLAAGTFPERVAAAASFHGANLATDREQSPHRLAGRIRGEVYVGVAERDPWLTEGESERLRQALEDAGVRHTIEIYPGTQHGFAVPDLPVHDAAAEERHWQRVIELFARSMRR